MADDEAQTLDVCDLDPDQEQTYEPRNLPMSCACPRTPLLSCRRDGPRIRNNMVMCTLVVVSTVAIVAVLVAQVSKSRVPSAEIGTFFLKSGADRGATTLQVHGSSLSMHGLAPDKLVIVNPGGPNEETASVAGLDPFSLHAPLEHSHEANEPLIALRATSPGKNIKLGSCSATQQGSPTVQVAADGAAALFDDLSPNEVKAVVHTFAQLTGAATGPNMAKEGQWFIIGTGAVELLLPAKKDALDFLDSGGPQPPRYARVTCARPHEGDVMEYRVGPITGTRTSPHVEPNAIQLLRDGTVPYAKRPPDLADASLQPLMTTTLLKIRGLLEYTFGNVFQEFDSFNPKEGIIVSFPVFPDLQSDVRTRITMAKFFWQNTANLKQIMSAMWLHPLPLVMRFNQTGADPSRWFAFGLYFCGNGPFNSAEELQAAHEGGQLKPCPWQRPSIEKNSLPGDWDVAGTPEDAKNQRTSKRGPRIVYPDGPRWKISGVPGGNGRKVEWMGWSLFVSTRPSTGMVLWDIRFNNKRVAYELSLQEAAALYGGGEGDQTYYLDTAMTGLGNSAPNLRLGADCPMSASTFNNTGISTLDVQKGFVSDWSAPFGVASGCIFEDDDAAPIWSHTNAPDLSTYGVRGSHLVVRSMANSGNYDYISNVLFGLDGSIEWKSQLAGFAETRWYNPEVNSWEEEISPIVRKNLAAPLHSHLLSVKVDLDIGKHAGNSVEKLESVTGFPSHAKAAGVLESYVTKYLKTSYLTHEGANSSTLIANSRKPQVWRVVNRDANGPAPISPPGYAIVPGEATVNTLPWDHPLASFVAYAKYAIAVTKHHDHEQRSSGPYDVYAPQYPYTSLDNYLKDHEALDRTDIVAWVTVSHEHIPRTEDIPLISNYAAAFKLVPWNYFGLNAAMDLPEDSPGTCLSQAL